VDFFEGSSWLLNVTKPDYLGDKFERLALEQVQGFRAAPKTVRINIVLVEQFEVEVAEWRGFFENRVELVAIAAPGHDHG
jgi:hypothetical protein